MRLIIMFTVLMTSVSAFAQWPANGELRLERFDLRTQPNASGTFYSVYKEMIYYLHPPAGGTVEGILWEVKSPEGTPLAYNKMAPGEVDFTDTQKLHAKYIMYYFFELSDDELQSEATLTYNCMSYVFGYEDVWISTLAFIVLIIENDLDVPDLYEDATISAHHSGALANHVSNISKTPVCVGFIYHFTGKFGAMGLYKTNLAKTNAASYSNDVTYLGPE